MTILSFEFTHCHLLDSKFSYKPSWCIFILCVYLNNHEFKALTNCSISFHCVSTMYAQIQNAYFLMFLLLFKCFVHLE